MRTRLAALRPSMLRDLVALAGLILIAVALWLVTPVLALLFAGVSLVVLAFILSLVSTTDGN